MIFLEKKEFMITLSQNIVIDIEAHTHSYKETFVGTTIILNKKMTNPNFQKNVLHEIIGKSN